MFIPLSDDDRRLVKPATVTWTLLAMNVAAFVYQTQNPEFTYGYSAVPIELTTGTDLVEPVLLNAGPASAQPIEIPHAPGPQPIYLTLFTSMFLHAGLMHLGSNMLFLWIFGDNVEHRFGHLPFLIFYLVSGVAGGLAQVALNPDGVLPMLGASGAISGVLGAYLVLFPYNRVKVIVFFYIVSIPAVVVIVLWAGAQLVQGYSALGMENAGGVAYAAHLGGFAAGVVVAVAYRTMMKGEPDTTFNRIVREAPPAQRWW